MSNLSSYHYNAYRLRIRSALPLPELIVAAKEPGSDAEPDVTIRLGEVTPLPCEKEATFNCRHATPEHIALYVKDVARFLIRDGSEIIVQPAPGVAEHELRIFVLGACFGAVLHQRGLLVLHASAVAVHDQVVAFVGHKGQGKSTMAAALHARGHPVIADDVMPVQLEHEGNPQVIPGISQLRLWPDAVAASLDIDPETLPRLHPQREKRVYRVNHTVPHASMPLSAIYVLSKAKKMGIEPIRPQEAFIELLRYSYAGRVLVGTNTSHQHFKQCTQLIQRVPILCLSRPKDLSKLSDVAWLIEQHVTEPHMLAL